MPRPLGYWIAVVETNPAQTLAELESTFGSYFEKFTIQQLHLIMAWCAVSSSQGYGLTLSYERHLTLDQSHAIKLISSLSPEIKLRFVQFLCEQIVSRGQD